MVERSGRNGRRASLPGVVAVLLVALLALFPPPLFAPALERMSFLLFDNFHGSSASLSGCRGAGRRH